MYYRLYMTITTERTDTKTAYGLSSVSSIVLKRLSWIATASKVLKYMQKAIEE
ncbi:hypothetical protein [Lactococcus petauri]|uniref:hypothetical protein n=1 Tax=Lactococcus petauri TaxID=1940789 RepID=UPI002550FBDD|nr:hypothetical protein [Lactococcus petauri]